MILLLTTYLILERHFVSVDFSPCVHTHMHSVDRRRHRTQSSKNFSFETVGSVLKIFQQVRYSNIGEKNPNMTTMITLFYTSVL